MDRRVVHALPTPHHNNPNYTATTTTPTVETDTKTPTTAMHLQTAAPSNYSLPHGSPPFQITPEDVELLAHSGGFAILRDHLAEYYNYE
jgi:hypothetical protein